MLDIFVPNKTPEPYLLDTVAFVWAWTAVVIALMLLVFILIAALSDEKMEPGFLWSLSLYWILAAGTALAYNWFNDQFTTDKQHTIVVLLISVIALLFLCVLASIGETDQEESVN